MGNARLTRGDVLRVAAEAFCGVSTVRKYVAGKRMYRLTEERVGNALRQLGFDPSEVRGSEPETKVA